MGKPEINKILDDSQTAIKEMEKVYEAHRNMATAVISPDSWVGKELLSQSKRLIDLAESVNRLESKLNRLIHGNAKN